MTASALSTRRQLLLALAAGALVTGVLPSCGPRIDTRALAEALRHRLRRLDEVRNVGRAVLSSHEEEARAATLGERLAADLGWIPGVSGEELDRRLGDRIRDDFRSGRLLEVDSWQLAATEARVAALMALFPA